MFQEDSKKNLTHSNEIILKMNILYDNMYCSQ